MNNFINYINHKLINPIFYHRQYDHDLKLEQTSSWTQTAARIGLIALPFFSLNKTFATGVSTVAGSCRAMTHLIGAYQSKQDGKWTISLLEIGLAAFAIMTVISALFSITLGLAFTTSIDILQNFQEGWGHIHQHLWLLVLEDALKAISSTLYLGILLTGSLELALASLVLNSLVCFYEAWKEFYGKEERRLPETLAKAAMGCIRLYQSKIQWNQIQLRNELLKHPFFVYLKKVIENGRDVDELLQHPLVDLQKEIDENIHKFGANFHGYGKELVKGLNLCFKVRQIDGKEVIEMHFRVNYLFRKSLETLLNEWQSFSKENNAANIPAFLELFHSHAKEIEIHQEKFDLLYDKSVNGLNNYVIDVKDLGSIIIGNDPNRALNLENHIVVRAEKEKNLYQLFELLSLFNLQDALKTASENDILRLKLAHLFHQFFPKESALLEKEEHFFSLPVETLKEEMIKKEPLAEDIFNKYLSTLELREVLPGRMRYAMPGLGEEVQQLGAEALMTVITGTKNTKEDIARLISMLQLGMLSTETRLQNGMQIYGLSNQADFASGGSDQVFLQLIPTSVASAKKLPTTYYNYNKDTFRLIISPKALEMGSYQYHTDNFGSKKPADIALGDNIFDFVAQEQINFNKYNEVMIKERVAPHLIEGVVVPSPDVANLLAQQLRENGLVHMQEGIDYVLETPLSRFIRTGISPLGEPLS